MSHTPGPWHSDGYERVRPMDGPQDGSNDICHVYSRSGLVGSVEGNANLIAAAPDLLAACEESMKLSDYLGDSGETGTERNWGKRVSKLLRDAIAKSRGT